jgi:hypothetical protein
MAAMAPAETQKLGVPSRNPLPLSASQEAQVRDIYYQRVRSLCADEIKGEFFWPIGYQTTQHSDTSSYYNHVKNETLSPIHKLICVWA